MKKTLSILLCVVITLVFSSCTTNNTAKNETTKAAATKDSTVTIRLAGMTGPTSMGLVKLFHDETNANSVNDYEFTIASTADEITPKLIKGEYDVAAIPANLASVLYNNTKGKIKVVAINTLGVLYIVENGDSVASITDLKGKTIYSTGKGSTPEYTLRYILEKNGINPDNDVELVFKSEPAEIAALLAKQNNAVAMLPQPYVTVAQSQVDGLKVKLNLSEEWEKTSDNGSMITGVCVVRSEFAKQHPQELNTFLEEYKASVDFVLASPETAAEYIEEFGIFKAAVAKKALPQCNITFVDGKDMKTKLSAYLQVLFDQNPKSVGGTMPNDEFYYEK